MLTPHGPATPSWSSCRRQRSQGTLRGVSVGYDTVHFVVNDVQYERGSIGVAEVKCVKAMNSIFCLLASYRALYSAKK